MRIDLAQTGDFPPLLTPINAALIGGRTVRALRDGPPRVECANRARHVPPFP
ncbi:hypothetical protein NXC14_PB00083 (plasmid) [Rhizobium sp. NXC14]|nr:hypothetical protein NXC14_PB00083 [Rhizobium sp. NXC14]